MPRPPAATSVFDHLQIYDPRERALVGLADAAARAMVAPFGRGRRRTAGPPARILLLRLERIGDLLMTLSPLADVRRLAPEAHIDLVTGSWNEDLARLVPGVDAVETLDAPWLARGTAAAGYARLVRQARGWRRHGYDLAINFEGDIRSNALAALSGARRRVGFGMAGGGPLLTDCVGYDPSRHVAVNAVRLLGAAFGRERANALPALDGWPDDEDARLEHLRDGARLVLPPAAVARANGLVGQVDRQHPLIGVHVSGGREIKQWEPARFGEVAGRLAAATGAAIVLTGTPADRPLVDRAQRAVPSGARLIDAVGSLGVVDLGALLARLDLLVTGDTGPMHLAAAVGTPTVAIFGPSSPTRWGPLTRRARIVRVDLPCSPCNRIRRPPARCVGHVPDCLDGITVDRVLGAAMDLLAERPDSATVRVGRP